MRVLLVYPNSGSEAGGGGAPGAVAEPIALEYVGAGAKLDGHEVRLLDLRLHPEDLDETLATFRPDVVGVTGYSMHVLRGLEICRRVKEVVPACRTVVGGHHATLEPIDFLESEVDFVVTGEGVLPFRRVLALLGREQVVRDVPGVWSTVDGGPRFGGEPEGYDLDSLPHPDRTLAAGDRHRYGIDWMRPIALLRTSAGCPFRCRFCSLWRLTGGRILERRAGDVVDELRSIPERYVFLVDDEAFVNARRMWTLGEEIRRAELSKNFFAYCRVDSLLRDLDLFRLWHGIGLERLFVGFESIRESELDDYGKRQKRDEILRALQVSRELGIHLFSNFIVGPGFTQGDFEDLVRFVEDNDVEYPAFTVLTPVPGSDVSYDSVVARQANGRPRWDLFDLQHAVTPTLLPPAEFAREYENLYRRFAPRHISSAREPGGRSPAESAEAQRAAWTRIALGVLGGGPADPPTGG